MKKNVFLFQLVFSLCFLFVEASDKNPNNNISKISNTNCIENFVAINNITVSEDTYVRGGSYDNDNFGSSTELFIKQTTNNNFVREALMKFDLSTYESITSAKIYFYAYAQVSMDVNVYGIDNDSWSENSVTRSNAPSFNTYLGAIALTTSYSWVELDISSAVVNDFSASDKTFSIGLKDDNTIKKTIRISSKENSVQYIPYIQIEGTLVGGGGEVAVTGVSVLPTSTTININDTQQLSATVSPSNATNQIVSWSSSNASIASVNSAGLVTGVAAGTTTVTATTVDGSFTSNMTITVNSGTEPLRDVYLVIGQSNTAGRGAIEAEDMVALNGVDIFNGSTWESAENTSEGLNRYSTIRKTSTQGLNFAYTFGRKLNEDTSNQIGLVVNARGGTNINDWAKGASAGYYAAAISQINLALAIPNSTLKGILWHQGESNRNDSNYLTKLSALIADLRSDLAISDLPFIAGQLSMERADNETFNANLETLPSLVSNTDYAESDALQTTDLTHFDSNAQRILGERYASKILQLVYNENPSIVCIEDISQTTDAGVDGATVAFVAPIGTDNSTSATTVQTAGLTSDSLFPIGITTNTFEVTDASGNMATCSFTITITDDEDPTIACLADINQSNDTSQDGAMITYITPEGTDNSSNVTTVQTTGLASNSIFPIGTTINTFEVTDASGNMATCSFTITITDDEDPIINCLADINQTEDSGMNGAIVTYVAPVGTDNSSGESTAQTAGLASGALFPIGITTNTFVATDAAGNTASCSFTVTIAKIDNENPTIVCISDISQTNDTGVDGAIVTYVAPVVTDNSSGETTVQTVGLPSESLFPIGITTNTFEVTDASGNTATCSFTVTITDDENPTIACLEDISQSVDSGVDGAIVTYVTPIGTDNSTGETTSQTTGLASGELFPVGTTTNTFIVTDASGNTANCSFTVTITEEVNTCGILIDNNNFNSNWGIWNDGGSDCRRNANDVSFANGGTGRCVRLRDNTSTSLMTTDGLDLSSYSEITVDFNFISDSMESGEDFWLQISTNGGSSYQTVADWATNTEFVNGTRYFESVTIQGPFPTDTYLRFRADASANADLIYIDDVKITGCSNSTTSSKSTPSTKKVKAISENTEPTLLAKAYPNPFIDNFTLKVPGYDDKTEVVVELFSLSGVLVSKRTLNQSVIEFKNMSSLKTGLYILKVTYNKGKSFMKKIIKADR